ncbi:DNA-processing protein DprA [Bacillus spongiae]|uniref:DNA-processing protein DprA n=1 Tax=Bacillus spongiae TaxID=2683610 RepID=A0ABU8HA15_9BACI
MIDKKRFIHLLHCQSLSWKNIYFYLRKDPTLINLYSSSNSSLRQAFQLSTSKFIQFQRELNSFSHKKTLQRYEADRIKIVTIFDQDYPFLLKNIFQPPWGLFCQGNLDLLSKGKRLAVVGARNANEYAERTLTELLPPLVHQNIIIVSGLATGVDTFAHKMTIKFNGDTIAVLGGGFNHIYPKKNEVLAREIANDYLLLSEYPPDTMPKKWHFPARNRIISGLSKGSLIVQAGARSGSLITAEMALNEGRDVFAIPGPIHHPLSIGTNSLIKQGAILVQTAEDILQEMSV